MPRRNDIHRILIIGSGPIVIGQACEFDYSGTQACKALRADGYEVILVNSNPATIMTDPELADRTYVEPLTRRVRRRDHPQGTPRRPALHRRRPDRPQPRRRTRRGRHPRQVRRRVDRRQDRRHQEGRRPPAVQGRHAQDRPRDARSRSLVTHRGGRPRVRRQASATPSSSGPASPSAAPAAASPTTARSSSRSSSAASTSPPSTKS